MNPFARLSCRRQRFLVICCALFVTRHSLVSFQTVQTDWDAETGEQLRNEGEEQGKLGFGTVHVDSGRPHLSQPCCTVFGLAHLY